MAVKAQPITVTSVGSVRHDGATQVTVVFSVPVEEASGTNTLNYTFTGGVATTGASLMTGLPVANAPDVLINPAPGGRVFDNQCVVLTVTGLASNATTTITVQNVKDRQTPANTLVTTNMTFTDSGYSWADSGTPAIKGQVIALGTNGFDIFSAGVAQWADYDEVTIVYKETVGDFDVKARVEFQDFSSHWARTGIMARESLNEGENSATQTGDPNATPPIRGTASRYADVHANPVMDFNENGPPPLIHPANNGWESHIRRATGRQGDNGGTDSQNDVGGNPPYPNAWVRIQRTGNTITTYHGADGTTWDTARVRDDAEWLDTDDITPLPLLPKMYVGPSYGPETGNINANDTGGKNRLFLYQVRFTPILVPYLRLVDATACGVLLYVDDAGSVSVNTSSVVLTVDGNVVTTTSVKSGATTIIVYKAAAPLPAGSAHPFTLTFNNTQGTSQTFSRSFTTPAYATIPASYALASPATTPGMAVNVYQIDYARGPGDENSIANAEEELVHGFVDATGTPYPNVASLATANVDYVNWEQDGADINVTGTGPQPDHFNSVDPAGSPIPNTPIPGIPGSGNDQSHTGAEAGAANNNIVTEVVTYLQLSPGCYRMGVNSDDGFKVSVAPGQGGPFGLVLGSFNGGRGSSDTVFDFAVDTAGYYPFRLLWWEGSGGANCEWYAVNLDNGSRILINGPQSGSIKAFRAGAGRAYVQSVSPSDGFAGAQPTSEIKFTLVNGTTAVVGGSISLAVDGAAVVPAINTVGTTTTVSYTGTYKFVSAHTATLIWGESTTPQTLHTNTSTFSVRQYTPADLPAASYWIEAEDFDATGTPVPAVVNTMPYDLGAGTGGAGPYDGIGATLDVDYHNNDSNDNAGTTTYRSVGDPSVTPHSVDLASDPGANYGLRRAGGFDMTMNYKIGWGDSADWYNYTRKIPTGLYSAVVALSNGSVGAGTPDRMGGTLSIVTAGVGTLNQTLKNVGTFNGPSSGAWSYNNLVPLYAPDGSQAAFKITATTTTLRFSLREGDYDWFALIPISGVPPKVTAASPLANTDTPAASAVPRDAKVRLTIEDFSTAVNASTVKLFFDGNDVTSTATVNKTLDITTVTYTPALMAGGSTHNYELRYSDNGTPVLTQTNKATFTVNAVMGTPGLFLIEAEDFNHDGGQTVAAASTMPYLGGAYANLGATLDVDYHDSDANDSRPYRGGLAPNVNHDQQTDAGTLDVVRGDSWTMTANFKLGWVGSADWYNYTRTFPANTYEVWAGLSHDPTDGLRGSLYMVNGDITTTNQTAALLGTFDAPTSGAWGTDNVVQMKDSSGAVAVVPLSGVQTVRFGGNSGDYDYLLFVPGAPQLKFNAPTLSGTQFSISWTGSGTLQEASVLTGQASDWSNTTGVTGSSYTATVGATGNKFYRLKQ